MEIPREHIKYGHSSGHSDFCYTSDGSKIISCGSDGDIRIWNGLADNDPTTICAGSEWARSIIKIGEYIYCSTEDCKVQVLTFPDLERASALIRPAGPVNQIVSSKDNKFAAICSEDMSVNLINLETNEKFNFYGLTGGGLSVSICPKLELLACSSNEGKLRIFDISDQRILKEIKCNYKSNEFNNAESLARIQFEPTVGNELAYPDNDKVFIMDVASPNYEIKKTLSCSKLMGTLFSIVAFSPCGRKLAASTANGDIVVWYIQTGAVIGTSVAGDNSGCTALCWNPTNNGELLYSDKTGRLGILNIHTPELALKQHTSKEQTVQKRNIHQDMDHDDLDDFDDDAANDIFADVNNRSEDELKFTKVVSDDDDDDDDDDENVVSIEKLKKKYMGGDGEGSEKNAVHQKSRSPTPRPRTPQTPLQPPFMPTSSPEHLDRRYMCWNHIAVIRCYNTVNDQEGDLNAASRSIEVDFHDSTFHSNYTMPNYNDFTMASVSETVLVTANNKQLHATPLTASTKKWSISIREPELIICLSTSDNMICIGTDSNLVHVYTVYGNQKSVLAAPGPIVTMASHGQYLLVAYHQSGVRGNDQVMGIMLVKFDGVNMDCRYLNAPLSPSSSLKWLGFSDKGSPGTFDSEGILFLYPFQSNVWIPFLNTRLQFSSPSDTLFVTSVHESTGTIRGTKCRSGVYPVFVPRPALLELPLQPPFVELSTDKGALESNLFTWSSLKVEDTEKKFKETALKSFALSCKSDMDMRAFELIENLKDPQIVTLAIKYASKMQRKRLAEKLMQIDTKAYEDETIIESIISSNNSKDETKINGRLLKPKENSRIMLSQKKKYSSTKVLVQESKTPAKENNEAIFQELFCTSTEETQNVQSVIANSEEIADSPVGSNYKIPFLKSSKKEETKIYNPLSLTDTFAGVGKLESKSAEKRKKTDDFSPPEAKQEKQRKLERFLFSKHK